MMLITVTKYNTAEVFRTVRSLENGLMMSMKNSSPNDLLVQELEMK